MRTPEGEMPMWLEEPPFFPGEVNPFVFGNFGNIRNLGVDELPPIYADRPAHQPGESTSYAYSAVEHPAVTLGLDGPNRSHVLMFLMPLPNSCSDGTVKPVTKSAILPDTGAPGPMATSDTELNFQIEYSQLYGVAPEAGSGGEISLWIDPGEGTPDERRYTLVPTSVLGTDIVNGVMYQTPTPIRLTPGRHRYYFRAGDGQRKAYYPVGYSDTGGVQWVTNSLYVNSRPQLTEVVPEQGTVNPALGTAGDNFRFRIKYTDADNQKPYQAYLWVKYGDGDEDYERVQMYKEDPSDDTYSDGCVYIYDSANLAHRLQPGERGHYFEFMDDWGARSDPHSRIPGETVYYPGPNFVNGPYIGANQRPVMVNGTVMSEDNTSNPATLWSYKVQYRDGDNHEPSYVNLYIGKAIKDAETGEITEIEWDYGNPMEETNPDDTMYSDGKDYVYTTRLDSSEPGDTFYYAFVASDGIDVALYDETSSPGTGCVYDPAVAPPFEGDYPPGIERIEPEDGSDGLVFQTTHYPIVGEIPFTPINKLYRYPLVYEMNGWSTGYTADYVNGLITLSSPSDYIDVQYWFATEGPVVEESNTAPTLENGQVTPNPGESTDDFVFSVIYKDPDGLYGQAPYFIRVKVDGIEYDLEPAYAGALNFKQGVKYYTSINLDLGAHQYYFEASDGSAYAVFDGNGGRSSHDVIVNHVAIPGPYVNDVPVLTEPMVFPAGTTNTAQAISYSVVYTDTSNEAPDTGYPVVYVDNPEEMDWNGTATSVSKTTITDSSKTWTEDQFKGMPLQITSGPAAGTVYRILSNNATTITVVAVDITADGVDEEHEFRIGKLALVKSDVSDNNYTDGVTYVTQIPSLGEGVHMAHFKSITTEIVGPDGQTRESIARAPESGELEGPTVANVAPPGNRAPQLADQSVSPSGGPSTETYTFTVTYTDADGDPPTLYEGRIGYVKLLIDGTEVYDMSPPANPSYELGAVMTVTVTDPSVLDGGEHRYHFEASDGYQSVRLPAFAGQYYRLNINRRPMLSEAQVSPTKGNQGRPFTYTVKYTDLDNNPPSSIKLWIDDATAEEAIEIKDYAVMPPGATYAGGVMYSYTLPAGELDTGEHSFYFTANDGVEDAVQTSTVSGPTVHPNLDPTLMQGTVIPNNAPEFDLPLLYDTDTYTYSVVYTDPNGDEPEYVRVFIDGSAAENGHLMVKDPQSSDFEDGVTYTFETDELTAGMHNYHFEASDWLDTARDPESGEKLGPNVTERPSATITIQCAASPRVGQVATISGTVSPAMAVPLTLKMTRPNGSVITRTVTSLASGAYTYAWTPDFNGTWKLQASWSGNAEYAAGSSQQLTVYVGGPTMTINGLQMIAVPLNPSNRYPDGCFGTDPAFALAKWMPAGAYYKMYSLLPGYRSDYDFPLISAGNAYWMKTLEPKVISPVGTLVNPSANYSIPVKAGWNQIGNPFVQEVNWGALQVRYNYQTVSLATAHANGLVREYGWRYDQATGNYKLVDASRSGAERTMQPWIGYWFKALVDCTVIVPSPSGGNEPPPVPFSTEAKANAASISSAPTVEWGVEIKAKNGNLEDGVSLGLASRAERIESPTCLENFVDLYLTDDDEGIYYSDLRDDVSSGDEWILCVATDTQGEVELTWDGLQALPDGVRLTLVDDKDGTTTVLKPGGSYRFSTDEGYTNRQFRVVLSSK